MYHVSCESYEKLADRIRESLRNIHYFNGSVAVCTDGETECRLIATLIIYRRRIESFSEDADSIADVIPVWWECRTTADGMEVCNDFDFASLRECLVED